MDTKATVGRRDMGSTPEQLDWVASGEKSRGSSDGEVEGAKKTLHSDTCAIGNVCVKCGPMEVSFDINCEMFVGVTEDWKFECGGHVLRITRSCNSDTRMDCVSDTEISRQIANVPKIKRAKRKEVLRTNNTKS